MPVYYPSQYIFDRGNTNYITAIAAYNKHLLVTKINDISLDKPFLCSKLPDYISQSELQKFKIDCVSEDESSTIDVFPKIEGADILAFIDIDQEKVDETLAPVLDELEKIKRALTEEISKKSKTEISPIQPITREQGALFLYKLVLDFSITGALFFEKCNTILFQHNGKNHLLTYGDRSYYSHYISHIKFDIDDGFHTEEDPVILTELQQSFRLWFKNDHVGPVIPKERSGFYKQTTHERPPQLKMQDEKSPHEEFCFSRGISPDFTKLSIEQMMRFAFFSSINKAGQEETSIACHALA